MPDYEGRFVDLVVITVLLMTTSESVPEVQESWLRTFLATLGFDTLVILSPLLRTTLSETSEQMYKQKPKTNERLGLSNDLYSRLN